MLVSLSLILSVIHASSIMIVHGEEENPLSCIDQINDSFTVSTLKNLQLTIVEPVPVDFPCCESNASCNILLQESPLSGSTTPPDKHDRRLLTPNDEFFHLQRGVFDQVQLLESWNLLDDYGYGKKREPTLIGVVDDGVFYNHEDLAIFLNKDDPVNGVDDDLNGCVDDYYGASFYTGKCTTLDIISDDSSHGTHVAGIIAGKSNNFRGISGAVGHFSVGIVPVRLISQGKSVSALLAAIDYLIGRKVFISNHSYSLQNVFTKSLLNRHLIPTTPEWMAHVSNMLHKHNHVMIAAPPNDGYHDLGTWKQPRRVNYPCNIPGAICVANCDTEFRLSPSSRFGEESVFLGAPGVGIWSTMGLSKSLYGPLSGTSMAAPMVSAIVGLMRMVDSSLSIDDIRKILCETVTLSKHLIGKVKCPGVINSFGAVQRVLSLKSVEFKPKYVVSKLVKSDRIFPPRSVKFLNR